MRTCHPLAAAARMALALLLAASASMSAAAAPVGTAAAAASSALAPTTAFAFGNADYIHRWSKDGQNEFTPVADPDVHAWHDMVTVIVYDNVHDGEQLAAVANRVLANWGKGGRIVRTNAIPAAPGQPAQHFMAAVLVGPHDMEVTFGRFRMAGDTGEGLLYAHRFPAPPGGTPEDQRREMARAAVDWLHANGADTEALLMAWEGAPPVAALRALPQSLAN